ncbi:mid1-interacting protein 1-B-like [Bombina bombina]|uniref:mid1-interacting protein 1-B-like n=1 Tax=Bombina bombina TaxID=8345 RepID=UPI00235A74A4|nr:mid1-interacting protein 1-B-like [Bombina bombina]XP_053548232.1 mid1-interacting protein 1-B-like [Bombina bombina]XP_053555355.1 mid1-interacting protein 1-B-like [Bombina bombina]XP_053555356.1 mid1-interacting protein 1-B-like [Bombina bombina]XP_053555357.1 mid1-interacting protein 1-B-like [Bombina bombina]XP_053555358.1 mid1-interacting protein 1-B-like [Bombina bombina]
MDVTESSHHRQSLLDAIQRFNAATTIMDETILVPSMLQDITSEEEEQENHSKSTQAVERKNLYDSYLLLKSLRHDMKWGISQENLVQKHYPEKAEVTPEDETGDLVEQFQHHLRGLLSVLTKLTKKANILTNSYKKEIGIGTSNNRQYSRSISH